ncbi:MAG: dinitrogenase iron-molybdenum cofactor biosynthesis protein [Firmicutes bacterium]|nr:dinitrogenase iron-molybdenum cofactor biosynthesis protein [Bacillota bacterium]
MKIAISATGNTLDGALDQRFGRAAFFLIVDPDTSQFEVINNEAAGAAGGAGITSAQTIVDKGVKAVITGNVGPNAMKVLNAAEIAVYRGVSASVRANIEKFKKRTLEKIDNAVPSHFGMGLTGGQK